MLNKVHAEEAEFEDAATLLFNITTCASQTVSIIDTNPTRFVNAFTQLDRGCQKEAVAHAG